MRIFRKKTAALLLAAVCAVSPAFSVHLQAAGIRVLWDGEPINVAAVIVRGRTLLPARDIVERLGGTVDWDGQARQVTINTADTRVLLTIDSPTAYVNGQPVRLDVPAQIVADRTKVPLRFVAEQLGVTVDFADGTVYIITETDGTPSLNMLINRAPAEEAAALIIIRDVERGLDISDYDIMQGLDEKTEFVRGILSHFENAAPAAELTRVLSLTLTVLNGTESAMRMGADYVIETVEAVLEARR